jgi:hypothetical protein
MAEPASSNPPAARPAKRDVLLATKLHLPRPRSGFLAGEAGQARVQDRGDAALGVGSARSLRPWW